MANNKEITRDTRIEIRLSQEEKNLWLKYSKNLGVNPTRLIRNLMMNEAESLINKIAIDPIAKAYIHYKKVTNDKEFLKRLEEE